MHFSELVYLRSSSFYDHTIKWIWKCKNVLQQLRALKTALRSTQTGRDLATRRDANFRFLLSFNFRPFYFFSNSQTHLSNDVDGLHIMQNFFSCLVLLSFENWKFASRCQIASGLCGPSRSLIFSIHQNGKIASKTLAFTLCIHPCDPGLANALKRGLRYVLGVASLKCITVKILTTP